VSNFEKLLTVPLFKASLYRRLEKLKIKYDAGE
jgi:hypothetical protein